MKVHLNSKEMGAGVISELSWEKIRSHLEVAFHIRHGEFISEVQPTQNGLRVKIENR